MYVWERLCELIDEKYNVEKEECNVKFDIELLKNSVEDIKKIMLLEPNLIVPELHNAFVKYGIDFYIMKSFPGAPVQGYIRKNSRNRLSLFMTIRGRYADIFWFSLFHKIAQIINGDAKNHFIDYDNIPSDIEKAANDLAENFLFSKKSYTKFINAKKIDLESIMKLATENNVKPYICIGRLMKEKYIKYNQYSQYREKYKLCED